jgi:hypothetical protein
MATTTLPRAATGYRSGLYEWVTTTDHKRIGILYIVNSFIFFFIGGILALGIRTELAQPGLAVQHQVPQPRLAYHRIKGYALFLPRRSVRTHQRRATANQK